MLSSAQICAARALIRWSAEELAMTVSNDLAVHSALVAEASVEFIDENGGGPGVRRRNPVRGKSGK
jgi:hypothetical protein